MDYVIQTSGLKKRYKRHEALRGVNLAVPAGTVLGPLSPNGAGKATTVRILTTLLKADRWHDMNIGHLLEGQTAAQLVVAADDLGWWQRLLGDGAVVVPATGLQRSLASALCRFGWLERAGQGQSADSGYRLSAAGREIAFNRGYVRVITRGWEPTFRGLSAAAVGSGPMPAATNPAEVARGCTDIARRTPGTIEAIAKRIADDPVPGTTIDLGCGDAARLLVIGDLASEERFIGVDIADSVIEAARQRVPADRFRLLAGSVLPEPGRPPSLSADDRGDVTTAMCFFLLHQLASDGGGIAAVLAGWDDWFPGLRRLVIGDVIRSAPGAWNGQPWFGPTFEIFHELTGVRMWDDADYTAAFAERGWRLVARYDTDHPIVVTSVLERP